MRKLAVAIGILSFSLLFSCKKELKEVAGAELTGTEGAERAGAAGIASDSAAHVPNQLLVRFKKGTSQAGRENVLSRITGKVQEHIITKAMQRFGDNEGISIVNTPFNALEALSKLKKAAEIENVELNYIYEHYQTSYTSNDTYYTNGSLWGMYGDATNPANQWGSQAGTAWFKGRIGEKSVVVGIIDEGVMHSHIDLRGNVDPTRGYDYANNDATTYDGASDEHGTHVAGTIGALGNNSTGVVGVNWNITMIPVKFLGSRGGTTANAIKSIDHFTELKKAYLEDNTKGANVVATNNSWGGGGYSKDLENAITRAGNADILFICATGNDGKNIDNSGSHSFPACYYNWNLIAVAAITSKGGLATYSNYGNVGESDWPEGDPRRGDGTHSFVDIGAPGSGINSTVPAKNGTGSTYASYNGTSMATPHVTGAVALYKSKYPAATATDLKNVIMTTAATPTTSLSKKCITGGRINVSGF